MKRIKLRMALLNIERAENLIVRKRFNLFVQNLKKIRSYTSKNGSFYNLRGLRFDFNNDAKDPGQGKISISYESER